MAKREFLQLADHYDPRKHDVAGWFISEKLDGTRCFWDGGISRGLPTEQVPWASVMDPKTGQKKAKIKPVATGLWSRYGNPIMAPDWWLNKLPACPLDGELWAGRGKFQLCRSICGGDTPDERFDRIVFAVYSTPPLGAIFSTGEIKNANMVATIDFAVVEHWVRRRLEALGKGHEQRCGFRCLPPGAFFADELKFMRAVLDDCGPDAPCYMHRQEKLIDIREGATSQVGIYLQRVLDQGGEGVVIRNPNAAWTPKRHKGILKYKPYIDAECVVVGFASGRETARGSRLLGMIGALVCEWNGKRFELAGLSDHERQFATKEMAEYAVQHPGAKMPQHFQGQCFRVGERITFIYREATGDGLPREARYWRKRNDIE
jgi:DNA ligase-1